ncbi:MAG: hypothetical protein HZB14_10555 [Actinobacteria bacterium]|nr:hypothetical protein [Actinomycetota bacterium]
MICALTARRIADGKTSEFIEAFSTGADNMPDAIRDRFKAVYACRDVNDPQVILTFGLFDGTLDELRALQDEDVRTEQLNAMGPLIEDVLFDSSFEVLHEFVGESSAATH